MLEIGEDGLRSSVIVNFRLAPEILKRVDRMVRRGSAKDRSDFIRRAIEDLLSGQGAGIFEDESQLDRLLALAKARGCSVSEALRLVLDRFLQVGT